MQPYLIKKPVITEKSLKQAATENKYTFEVAVGATKDQIKDAVEKLFGVKVIMVNTIKSQPSTKRTGKKRTLKGVPSVKKAIVKLKAGQKIELFDFEDQA
jgi:large subunit ribosomal protein L23